MIVRSPLDGAFHARVACPRESYKARVEAALAARPVFLTADNANFHFQNNLIVPTKLQER